MRIERGQHALQRRVDQLALIGHVDILGADAVEDLAEEVEVGINFGRASAGLPASGEPDSVVVELSSAGAGAAGVSGAAGAPGVAGAPGAAGVPGLAGLWSTGASGLSWANAMGVSGAAGQAKAVRRERATNSSRAIHFGSCWLGEPTIRSDRGADRSFSVQYKGSAGRRQRWWPPCDQLCVIPSRRAARLRARTAR